MTQWLQDYHAALVVIIVFFLWTIVKPIIEYFMKRLLKSQSESYVTTDDCTKTRDNCRQRRESEGAEAEAHEERARRDGEEADKAFKKEMRESMAQLKTAIFFMATSKEIPPEMLERLFKTP